MKKLLLTFIILLTFTGMCNVAASDVYEKTYDVEIANADIKYVTFTVFKPSDAGEISFDTMNDTLAGYTLYDLQTADLSPDSGNTVTFKLTVPDTEPRGRYTVRIVQNGNDPSKTVSQIETVYIASATQLKTSLDGIYGAEGDDILQLIDEGIADEIFEDSQLPELDNVRTSSEFASMFDVISAEMYPDGFSSVEDLADTLAVVSVTEALNRGSSSDITESMNKYSSLLGDDVKGYLFEGKTEESALNLKNKFAQQIITQRTSSWNKSEDGIKQIRTALGLTLLSHGSIADKAAALEEYKTELGIDTSSLGTDVTLTDVASYMTSEVTTAEAAKSAFTTAATKAANDKNSSSNNTGSSGSSGSSGGGSKGSSYSFPAVTKPVQNTEPITTTPAKVEFEDIDEAEWAEKEIYALAEKQIISGYNGYFYPNRNISRAEFTKLVVIASGISTDTHTAKFSDVKEGDWYYPYVAAATEHELVNGKGDGSFGAEDMITRQDAAVIIARAAEKEAVIIPKVEDTVFADESDIEDYAKPALKGLNKLKIINGFEDGTVRPATGLTRAEAAVIIYRLIGIFENGIG